MKYFTSLKQNETIETKNFHYKIKKTIFYLSLQTVSQTYK